MFFQTFLYFDWCEDSFFLPIIYLAILCESPQSPSLFQIRGCSHILFVLFLQESINCGYSLEVPHRSASDEYPQCMLLWRHKKNTNTFWLKKVPYLKPWSLCLIQNTRITFPSGFHIDCILHLSYVFLLFTQSMQYLHLNSHQQSGNLG